MLRNKSIDLHVILEKDAEREGKKSLKTSCDDVPGSRDPGIRHQDSGKLEKHEHFFTGDSDSITFLSACWDRLRRGRNFVEDAFCAVLRNDRRRNLLVDLDKCVDYPR